MALWDDLWTGAHLATMAAGAAPYGAIEQGALAVEDGRIAWVGAAAELPGAPEALARRVHDAGGAWITPGLVDCHTHLVYGGDRAREFELRLTGASYEQIARAGGGIRYTVEQTRKASEDALYAAALPRLRDLTAEGVTTVEIKSGYGLTLEDEMKMLRVARRLGESEPVTVKTTYLGAHALPPEFDRRPEDYIDSVVAQLPQVAASGLADAVDAFCERIAFYPEQVARVFEAATLLGLPVKLHADQLSDSKGANLVARFGGLSADHLEYACEEGIRAMALKGAVAVLLPGAFYFLRETRLPPMEALRRHGVPIALATDCNPGSSPCTSLLLMLNMGCTLFRLTPEEALAGVTRNGARALGMAATHGTLEPGKAADFVLWDITHPAELAYRIGHNPCRAVVKDGEVVRGD
ncbi:MAG TPA: imidazolonepropionase [Kiloniellaceae bacterium]